MSADAARGAAGIPAQNAAAIRMDARVVFGARVLLEVVFSDASFISRSFGAKGPRSRNPCRTVHDQRVDRLPLLLQDRIAKVTGRSRLCGRSGGGMGARARGGIRQAVFFAQR